MIASGHGRNLQANIQSTSMGIKYTVSYRINLNL